MGNTGQNGTQERLEMIPSREKITFLIVDQVLSLHSTLNILNLSTTPVHEHHFGKNLEAVKNMFVNYNSWIHSHEPLPRYLL